MIVAIALGGLVSIAIVITSAVPGLTNVIALQILRGFKVFIWKFCRMVVGIGLLATRITSSITAFLAAAYVVKGCLGWQGILKTIKFKLVWASIILLGVTFSSFKLNPIEIIRFAQIANWLILPIIAIFLCWIVDRSSVLGRYKNSMVQNILGMINIIIAIFLGAKSIYIVFQSL